MFDHPWVRRFGPFSRIGSLCNVVIVVAITVVSILSSGSDFERQGRILWGVVMAVVFTAIAIVVWVRWLRSRNQSPDATG